jgi:hypothetical protein
MSSRLTPIQPNPKYTPDPTGSAALNHAMAAVSFPRTGPHVLPPSSVLAESPARLAPPAHLQPTYVPRSPLMKLEPSGFSNHSRPFGSPPHALSFLPPPPPRLNSHGAAPLGQLLHPVSYTPSDPSSPASSYAPYGSDRSSNGGASFRSAPLRSPTEYGSYRGTQLSTPNWVKQAEPAGSDPYASAASYTRPAASMQVSSTSEPRPKLPDM